MGVASALGAPDDVDAASGNDDDDDDGADADDDGNNDNPSTSFLPLELAAVLTDATLAIVAETGCGAVCTCGDADEAANGRKGSNDAPASTANVRILS